MKEQSLLRVNTCQDKSIAAVTVFPAAGAIAAIRTSSSLQSSVRTFGHARATRHKHMPMQDTARSFAGKQSDEAKFQLYMEATHFAETIENLNDAEYRITQMLDILHNQGRQFRVS